MACCRSVSDVLTAQPIGGGPGSDLVAEGRPVTVMDKVSRLESGVEKFLDRVNDGNAAGGKLAHDFLAEFLKGAIPVADFEARRGYEDRERSMGWKLGL